MTLAARVGVNNIKFLCKNHCFLEEQVKFCKILSNPPIVIWGMILISMSNINTDGVGNFLEEYLTYSQLLNESTALIKVL